MLKSKETCVFSEYDVFSLSKEIQTGDWEVIVKWGNHPRKINGYAGWAEF